MGSNVLPHVSMTTCSVVGNGGVMEVPSISVVICCSPTVHLGVDVIKA